MSNRITITLAIVVAACSATKTGNPPLDTTDTIDPAKGGTVVLDDVTLEIPPRSLLAEEPVEVRLAIVEESVPPEYESYSALLLVSPDLNFDPTIPATLRFPVDGAPSNVVVYHSKTRSGPYEAIGGIVRDQFMEVSITRSGYFFAGVAVKKPEPPIDGSKTGALFESDNCLLWARNPPALNYPAPALLGDEVFIASNSKPNLVMKHKSGQWSSELSPVDFGDHGTWKSVIKAGSDWLALKDPERNLRYRDSSSNWKVLPLPSIDAVEVSHIAVRDDRLLGSFRRLEAYQSYIAEYKDNAWDTIDAAFPGDTYAMWADTTRLYVASSRGLDFHNGQGWVGVPRPDPNDQFIDVAGTVEGEVYALATTNAGPRHLYHHGQAGLSLISPPCESADMDRIEAGKSLVLVCGQQVYRYDQILESWESLELPSRTEDYRDIDISVSSSDRIMLGAEGGILMEHQQGAWNDLPFEEAPPANQSIAGNSAQTVYAVGPGVARLSDQQRWQPVAGAPEFVRGQGWLTNDDVLFVGGTIETGGVQSWRYVNGKWILDLQREGGGVSTLVGRSNNDVYVAVDCAMLHWDGSEWSALADLPDSACASSNQGKITQVALAGQSMVLTKAYSSLSSLPVFSSFDGVTWQEILGLQYRGPYQLGPGDDPSALFIQSVQPYEAEIVQEAGTLTAMGTFPGVSAIAGPSNDDFVASYYSMLRRYQSGTWTAEIRDWPIEALSHISMWSDSDVTVIGGEIASGKALLYCDLP